MGGCDGLDVFLLGFERTGLVVRRAYLGCKIMIKRQGHCSRSSGPLVA